MECSRCGFSNAAGFRFCGNCGDRLSKICPNCDYENLQQARFCSRCGSVLGNLCPGCGYDNLQSARFCGECGLQLDKVCSECNTINPLYARFCNLCGKSLPEAGEKGKAGPPVQPGAESRTSDPLAFRLSPPAPLSPCPKTPTPVGVQVQPQEEAVSTMKAHVPEFDYARQLHKFIPPALRDMYLDARGNIEGEKKIVNMIFSDVTGFTALSEKHADEPEEVQRLINECLRRQAEQVYALEGYVDKFVGDELVALFGAPIWHEDDAQRAVMAAIKMRDAVEEYSDGLEKEKGVRIHVHIGVNTGRVSVGGIGDDMFMNYTVMGDPVNLASRIESIAEAGEIIVGELTYKLTKALFDYKEPKYEKLKGKAEPQPIYELIGPKEHPESMRGIEGLTSEMIGREPELESLRTYAEKAFAVGATHASPVHRSYMVSVIGEAGLGKSRLKQEFKAELGDSVVWIEGRCLELTRRTAYSVFLDAIKSWFGVGRMDTEEQIRTKLTAGVRQLFKTRDAISPTEDILPYLFQLMSLRLDEEMEEKIKYMLDDPDHLQKQVFLAIRTLLLQMAKERPLVLALEDLHWIDDLSLDLILFLMESSTLGSPSARKDSEAGESEERWGDPQGDGETRRRGEAPCLRVPASTCLIMCTHRPERQNACHRMGIMARERFSGNYGEVILDRLSDNDMELLLNSLLPLEESEDNHDLKELILRKAEGNPFYLEEVIRTLLEDKVIEKAAGGAEYVIMQKVEDINVPTGVESIVRARIDRLTDLKDGSKQTLLRASVIGRIFERRILESISPEHVDLDKHLDRLLAMELIACRGESCIRPWPEQEYSFRHILTHSIAYDSIIGRERRKLHGQVGDRVEELYPEHLYPDRLEYIVGHYRLSDNYDKATTYLIKAGHKARQLYNNAAAVDYYTDALEKMEKLASSTGISACEDAGGTGIPTCETEVDDKCKMQVEVYEGLGGVYRVTSKFDEALESYGKAMEFCRIPESKAAIYRRMGDIYEKKGDYDASKEQYEAGLTELKDYPDSVELPRLYSCVGYIHYRRGEYSEAIRMCEQALEMLDHKDDYVTVAETYKNLAIARYLMGNAEEAFVNMELSVEMAESANDRMLLARLYNTKAEICMMSGNLNHTTQIFQRVLEMRMELGDIDGQATTKNSLGIAYTKKGEYDKAITYSEDSLELAQRVGNVRLVADSYINLGVVYWYMKEFDKSIECYQKCLAIYEGINFARGIAGCTGNIAEVYREKGDLEEAEKYHLEAIEIAMQISDREMECRQYHGLGEIHLAKGDYTAALEHLGRAMALAKELNDREAMGDACRIICEAYRKTDRLEEAQDYFNQARDHYAEIGAEAKLKELQKLKARLAL